MSGVGSESAPLGWAFCDKRLTEPVRYFPLLVTRQLACGKEWSIAINADGTLDMPAGMSAAEAVYLTAWLALGQRASGCELIDPWSCAVVAKWLTPEPATQETKE